MHEMIQGDLEPDMTMTITVDGIPQDLSSAASVQLYWVKPDGTSDTVALAPVNLASGQVRRIWVAGDTDVVGYHYGRVVATWPTGDVQHFPNDGSWIYWAVYARE